MAGPWCGFHGLWAFCLHGPHFSIKKLLKIIFCDRGVIKMNMFISPDFEEINNMLMDPQCIMDSGAPQCPVEKQPC